MPYLTKLVEVSLPVISFNILKDNTPILLNTLKTQSGLSNKKWDKTIKGLTKNGIAKVNKTDDGLFVEVV